MLYLNSMKHHANIRTFNAEGRSGGAGGETSNADANAGKAEVVENAETKDATVKEVNQEKLKAVKPTDNEASLLREVMAMKEKLQAATSALKNYEGIDPAKYRELADAQAAAEQAEAERAGDFERAKQMIVNSHNEEKKTILQQIAEREAAIAERDSKINALSEAIDKLTLGASFTNSNFIRKEMTLSPETVRKLYGDRFELEDGVVVAYDKPAGDKTRTKIVDGSGKPLGFDDAIRRIVENSPDAKSVMAAKIKAGGGSSTSTSESSKEVSENRLYGKSRIQAFLDGDGSK